MKKLLFIACAGAVGTLARYGLAGLVQRSSSSLFPWGTMAVNILGCFAAGCAWSIAETRFTVSGEIRAVLFIGFFGAFTTFSTYMLETTNLLRDGQWLHATGNVAAQSVLGVAAIGLGLILGRAL